MSDETPSANRYASLAAWRAVDDYFADALAHEDAALVEARESSAATTLPHAEVSANQGALLGVLVQLAGARRVLEFGTLAGYSTIWLARAAGAAGRVITLEREERNAAIARENLVRAGVADRVEVVVGPAAESAQHFIDARVEPFDFVFIDADKPSNPIYLRAALELTRPGAVIVVDNVVRNGAVVDGANDDPGVRGVRDLVADIANNPLLEAAAVQTVGIKGWDGMIVLRRG